MAIETKNKIAFLEWVIQHVNFPRRECYWLLNYLVNHDVIVSNVHFVEAAARTPRGLVMTHDASTENVLCLSIHGHQFNDAEQIFHEIRLNWNHRLFFEIKAAHLQQSPLYLAVLEDNPYFRWNDSLAPELIKDFEGYFAAEEIEWRKHKLKAAIDESLKNKNVTEFMRLTTELKTLEDIEIYPS